MAGHRGHSRLDTHRPLVLLAVAVVVAVVACTSPEPTDCSEPYSGRHQLSRDFEASLASLSSWFEGRAAMPGSRLGPRAAGWGVHLVVRDEPISSTGPVALSTRIEACSSTEIQIAAGELVWGHAERLHLSVLHELQHAVVLSHLTDADTHRVPVWVMEGLAVWGADQIEHDATNLIGDHVLRPWALQDVATTWTLPTDDEPMERLDYLMSGAIIDEVLDEPADAAGFISALASGRDAVNTLSAMAQAPLQEIVERARRRAAVLLERRATELDLEETSVAMLSGDEEVIAAFASSRVGGELEELLHHQLQRNACRSGPLLRCERLASQVRGLAGGLSSRALARSEVALARAYQRHGDPLACAERSWLVLRRASGAMTQEEIARVLRLAAACHAESGDGEGLLALARSARALLLEPSWRRENVEGISVAAQEVELHGVSAQILQGGVERIVVPRGAFRGLALPAH